MQISTKVENTIRGIIVGVVFYNQNSASIPTKISARKATGFDCQSYQGLSKDLHPIDNLGRKVPLILWCQLMTIGLVSSKVHYKELQLLDCS